MEHISTPIKSPPSRAITNLRRSRLGASPLISPSTLSFLRIHRPHLISSPTILSRSTANTIPRLNQLEGNATLSLLRTSAVPRQHRMPTLVFHLHLSSTASLPHRRP